MKRVFIILLSVSTPFIVHAQIFWDGDAADGNWSSAANWSTNVVPNATEDVVLDNSFLTSSYTVILPMGNVSTTINSITITATADNTIALHLPFGNIANPGIAITGAADALVLNKGGILKNSSGASAGSGISIANSFRINNGGRYIHNTRRGNADIINQLSSVVGTEKGIFEFDVPTAGSFLVSLSNRTFGSLVLSANASGGNKIYTASGIRSVTINGDFDIMNNATLSYGANVAVISIAGNCHIHTNATLNISNGINSGTVKLKGDLNLQGTITESGTSTASSFQLTGTANQKITAGNNAVTNSVDFAINNTEGATLLSPLTLPFKLTLANGKIKTDQTNILTLVDNAIVVNASNYSFIDGPMKKIGDESFIFPIGKAGIYAPIGILNPLLPNTELVTDAFTAEYHRQNPQSVYGINYDTEIDHISYSEYWMLDRKMGNAPKQVLLDVHMASFCRDISSTFVSHYNGSKWIKEPSSSSLSRTKGQNQLGNVTTVEALSNFSPFTLATNRSFSVNPLPIKLVGFTAKNATSNIVKLNWQLGAICSKYVQFEVQRSDDGKNFYTIAQLIGNEKELRYEAIDAGLQRGSNYYRLRITDEDASIIYSDIEKIIYDGPVAFAALIAANPIINNANFIINVPAKTTLSFVVYDLQGRKVEYWRVVVSEGTNLVNRNLSKLSAGIYHVLVFDTSGKVSSIKFIKQ